MKYEQGIFVKSSSVGFRAVTPNYVSSLDGVIGYTQERAEPRGRAPSPHRPAFCQSAKESPIAAVATRQLTAAAASTAATVIDGSSSDSTPAPPSPLRPRTRAARRAGGGGGRGTMGGGDLAAVRAVDAARATAQARAPPAPQNDSVQCCRYCRTSRCARTVGRRFCFNATLSCIPLFSRTCASPSSPTAIRAPKKSLSEIWNHHPQQRKSSPSSTDTVHITFGLW